jgi:hypothetical protein
MCILDPNVTTAPSAEDAAALEEARAHGFDTVEELDEALDDFANYDSSKFFTEE